MATSRNRATGLQVTWSQAAPLGIDTPGGLSWVTICEEHNTFVASATKRLALLAKTPTFCDDCREEFPHLAG